MRPIVLRKRRKKTKYNPILRDANTWPVVQMAKKRKEFVNLVFEETGLKVYEMGDPFHRAWFVDQVVVIDDSQQAISRLAATEQG